jgi:CheY-like chemotaxis protein
MAGEKILDIDDSPTVQRLIHMILSSQGYEVVLASDGEEGIAMARSERPAVILVDFVMPKMNGFQVCKILKDDPDNALSLNYLGYMYADRGVKLEESEKMIQRALEIEPDNGAFLDSYAWVLYKLGKYEKAIDAMNSALENEQEDPILYDHQGDIYAALNQFDKANDSWKKALELDPDNETIRAKIKSR